MSGVLDDKVVIVTGAAGGIGEGYARAISAAGARVVAADLDEGGGRADLMSIFHLCKKKSDRATQHRSKFKRWNVNLSIPKTDPPLFSGSCCFPLVVTV